MNLNTIAILTEIVLGIITIIKLLKDFFKKDNIAIQQQNQNGDNYYIDQRSEDKIIYNVNNSITSTNSSDDYYVMLFYTLLSLALAIISYAFYSQVYRIMPFICMVFFTISVFKGLSIPFTNKLAKIYWYFEKLILLILIILLFFTPKLILNTINQTPHITINSFPELINWFKSIFNIIKSLWNGDRIILFNLFGRIWGTFLITFLLVSQIPRKNKKINDTPKKIDFLNQIFIFFFFLIMLNINSFWELILPIRTAIKTWFSPK